MRRLWTEKSFTFEGRFDRIDAAGINPLPIQRPIPIWLGGAADAVLKRIAELGDGWYLPSYLNEEQIVEHIGRLHNYARDVGRDPTDIGIDGIVRMWGRSPEQSAESLAMWKRVGATHATFNTESDSYRKRLPSAHMELQGERKDWQSMKERIEAIRRFKEASSEYLA
jgi:alkanesulfonate monooxygenase SsuD/methylene tetrahydromethanopterin reductase-like flavin-dependent oxidoreductase (luciferase family)